MRLVLATRNPGKIKEVRNKCKGMGIELVTLDKLHPVPPLIEDDQTFRENALKKARIVADYTGEFSMADDSGLEVDFLHSRPGVLSSRFAGEDATDEENNKKLLKELEGVPISKRVAVFRCVITLVGPGVEEFFEGECKGVIVFEPRGKKGFGYDPLFYLPDIGKTMAELDTQEKNSISHRAKALQGLMNWLKEHKGILTKA